MKPMSLRYKYHSMRISFRTSIILYVLLAIGLGTSALYIYMQSPYWLLSCWLAVFCMVAIVRLIRMLERAERELDDFLMAIQQGDFTNKYPQTRRNSPVFHRAFNSITKEFVRLRSEKESDHHFLQTVLEHSGVPLLAFAVEDERITLANRSVKELFHLSHISQLSTLNRISEGLADKLRQLKSHEKVLWKMEMNGATIYLSVIARELVLRQKRQKVVAFHNINAELDQKEIESWQKLIRVLTHEIKNSVIPISTLAEVIADMIVDNTGDGKNKLQELSEEDAEDLIVSVRTIEKRSKGLVKFVTNYGDMARVPKPELELVDLNELVRQVAKLEAGIMQNAGVKLTLNLSPGMLEVTIDRQMIEQVLINLIKNALEAVQGRPVSGPEINLITRVYNQEISLVVSDNGVGMDRETLENIFVPFFTTKKDGSGIGLSYSRQVMRAHRGNITVRSSVAEGTAVELRFGSMRKSTK